MASSLIIRSKPGNRSKGVITIDGHAFSCALGRAGMTATKQEGDGATPIIVTNPLHGFYRADRESRPLSRLAFIPIRKNWGWCDDPGHPSYNQLVTKPIQASHENMWRQDYLYDLAIVLDINITRRIRRKGSALFMHVAREGLMPTEGCIALRKADLRRILTVMDKNTPIIIKP